MDLLMLFFDVFGWINVGKSQGGHENSTYTNTYTHTSTLPSEITATATMTTHINNRISTNNNKLCCLPFMYEYKSNKWFLYKLHIIHCVLSIVKVSNGGEKETVKNKLFPSLSRSFSCRSHPVFVFCVYHQAHINNTKSNRYRLNSQWPSQNVYHISNRLIRIN